MLLLLLSNGLLLHLVSSVNKWSLYVRYQWSNNFSHVCNNIILCHIVLYHFYISNYDVTVETTRRGGSFLKTIFYLSQLFHICSQLYLSSNSLNTFTLSIYSILYVLYDNKFSTFSLCYDGIMRRYYFPNFLRSLERITLTSKLGTESHPIRAYLLIAQVRCQPIKYCLSLCN